MTARLLFPLVLAATLSTATLAAAEPALLPVPRSVSVPAAAPVPLNAGFRMDWSACSDRLLRRAGERFLKDATRITGRRSDPATALAVRIECPARDPAYLTLNAKEGYRLTVDATGVTIRAQGRAGVIHALATLRQLIEYGPQGSSVAQTDIDDAPRFRWRGIMIDVSRHFMTVETLTRQIDAMEAVKLNVLHLHLSDNEGFRVESRRYPRLHEIGGHGEYYTQAEIRDLVAYAADRGVRIVPEFDVPGHSLAMRAAYPELSSGPLEERSYVAARRGALNPAKPGTFRFLDGLFGEMAGLFPDAYFHIGGDEVNGGDWAGDPGVQALMRRKGFTTKRELERDFHLRLRAILARHSKTMIGWEEIGQSELPDDVVIQPWRAGKATAAATAQGNPVIVSAGYYLDWLDTSATHYAVDPLDPGASGLTEAQFEEMRHNPTVAPLANEGSVRDVTLRLTPAQEALVLGGEGPIWSETVSDEMLDSRLWPRAAALAERFWSRGDVRDVPGLYRRLNVTQDRLRLLGLRDDTNRRGMAGRLAPGEAEPVETLIDVVAPARRFGHYRGLRAILAGRSPATQDLIELADAASPDSLVARAFDLDAQAYVAGDRTRAGALRSRLRQWRDNHERFGAVAAGRPLLEVALPVSQDLKALSEAALEAMDAIEAGARLSPAARQRALDVVGRQARWEAASMTVAGGLTQPQPPADLLIAIVDGVRTLVDRADSAQR